MMTEIVAIYQLAIPDIGRERRLQLTPRVIRATRVPTSIIAAVGPAPLVDSIAATRRMGRPSRRPEGIPPRIWEQWRRNVATRGHEDTPEALARWMVQRKRNITALRLRLGWDARREIIRFPEAQWVTIIHRKDLSASLEREWMRRIAQHRPGDPIYRIHLRGVQRREVR